MPVIGSIVVLLSAAVSLSAAPDPDIFDGRVAPPPSSPENSPSSPELSGETETSVDSGAQDEASAEARDMSQIEETTQGETVSAESSKTGGEPSTGSGRDFSDVAQVGGGESAASVSSKSEASAIGGGGGDVPPAGTPSGGGGGTGGGEPSTEVPSTGGGGGAGAPTERSFEDFGFGSSGGGSETVEVKRSKDMTVPTAGSSSTLPPSSKAPNQSGGSGGSGGATSSASGSGDYGSNLPSGL